MGRGGVGTGIDSTETGAIDADTGSTGTGTGTGIQGLSSSWNDLQYLDQKCEWDYGKTGRMLSENPKNYPQINN